MGQQENIDADQPIGKSWSSDWAKAEEQAATYEAEQSQEAAEAAGETTDENQQSQESDTTEDSSGESQASSEQEESGTGSGERDSEGELREVSPEGGMQRELLSEPERLKAVKEEAAALGLQFEGQTILTSERAKFREEKRNMRNKLSAERQKFEEQAREATTTLEAQAEKAKRLESAIEANDPDAIAQVMGLESWNHLSEQVLKRQMNPEHKELMRLRREQREQSLQSEKDQKTQAQKAQQQKAQQERMNYTSSVAGAVAKSKKYKAFADDPMFVTGVVKHQEANWDGEETISIDEASELALKDARRIYDTLHKRFGGQAASQPEKQSTSETSVAEKSGRSTPPKTVSQSEVADASGNDDSGDFDEKAWLRKWSNPIKESVAH